MTRMEIRNAEQFLQPPEAVIFDTDNTLYHYDPPHRKAMLATEAKAAKLLGVGNGEFKDAFDKAQAAFADLLKSKKDSYSPDIKKRLKSMEGLSANRTRPGPPPGAPGILARTKPPKLSPDDLQQRAVRPKDVRKGKKVGGHAKIFIQIKHNYGI